MAEELKHQDASQSESVMELSDFDKLLNQEFKPKSEEADQAVKGAVRTLVGQALEHASLVSDNAVKTIEGIISELDKKLSAQLNEIIHHKDYEGLESAWRGYRDQYGHR